MNDDQPPPLPQPTVPIPVAHAIAYDTFAHLRPAPSNTLFLLAIIGWSLAAGLALLLFVGLLLTQSPLFIVFGFVWAWLGGLITFVALILGIVYGCLAMSSGYAAPATRRRAVLAWALPASNVVLWLLLLVGGAMIFSTIVPGGFSGAPAAATPARRTPAGAAGGTLSLTVSNPSSFRIDTAGIVLASGRRIELGPIEPGSTRVRTINLDGTGPVTIRCLRRDGARWTQTVLDYITDGQTTTPSVELDLVPPAETRPPAP